MLPLQAFCVQHLPQIRLNNATHLQLDTSGEAGTHLRHAVCAQQLCHILCSWVASAMMASSSSHEAGAHPLLTISVQQLRQVLPLGLAHGLLLVALQLEHRHFCNGLQRREAVMYTLLTRCPPDCQIGKPMIVGTSSNQHEPDATLVLRVSLALASTVCQCCCGMQNADKQLLCCLSDLLQACPGPKRPRHCAECHTKQLPCQCLPPRAQWHGKQMLRCSPSPWCQRHHC